MADDDRPTRRDLLHWLGATAALGAGAACSPAAPALRPGERQLLERVPRPWPLVTVSPDRSRDRAVLRRRADPAAHLPAPARRTIDAAMRETLARSGGVGLAAPQVDLSRRIALVQLERPDRPVLLVVDPRIVWASRQVVDGYEGCLSVPGVGGLVSRSVAVEVTYRDLAGRAQRHRAEAWEARIFQHELDHLDGVLYLDRLTGPVLPLDEVRRRRAAGHAAAPAPPAWIADARASAPGPVLL
jgi:peptide deformylase